VGLRKRNEPWGIDLTYTPEWEPFGKAIERIGASGLSEADAKKYLCREISDHRIGILQHLAADRRRKWPAKTYLGLLNAARIFPEDIDWLRSRPSRISPAFANSPLLPDAGSLVASVYELQNLIKRTVELIDVKIADVTRIFCNSESVAATEPVIVPPSREPNREGARITAAKQAIMVLWPHERADELSSKEKHTRIRAWLTEGNIPIPSDSTIARALRQLRR
jgi:hypothetical protein